MGMWLVLRRRTPISAIVFSERMVLVSGQQEVQVDLDLHLSRTFAVEFQIDEEEASRDVARWAHAFPH